MPQQATYAKRLIITPGEPGGIGGEILVDAVAMGVGPLVTIDDPARISAIAKAKNTPIKIKPIDTIEQADHLPDDVLAILPIDWSKTPEPGIALEANAPQVIDAITIAVEYARNGLVKGIVTNPIQKSSLYAVGFSCPGHTEYLGQLDGPDAYPVMMLACKELKAVPLTIHIPLADVPEAITAEKIIRVTSIVDDALRRDFGLHTPKIMVAGLNPHAGENGTIGHEDHKIIAPAVQELNKLGVHAAGPVSADTLFHEERRQDYDAVIAMYHDQALIPVKTLDFHGGVNITLGLSYIRTSPDHGTALDQAGKFTANPKSLIAAITMAEEMATQRRSHDV